MSVPAEPRELPDRLTLIPQLEFVETAAKCWRRFYGEAPKATQLDCALAQMVLETGRERDYTQPGRVFLWGKHAHNHNWGNVKSKKFDENHCQFYECGEELSASEARRLKSERPNEVKILKFYNGGTRASVTFLPKHPQTKFRAYETAEDGMMDYIRFLVVERATRYGEAWKEGVLKGDIVTFSRLLGENGYYTAPIPRYTKTMVKLFQEFLPMVSEVLAPSKDEEWKREADKLMSAVSVGIHQSLSNAFGEDDSDEIDEDDATASITPNVPH